MFQLAVPLRRRPLIAAGAAGLMLLAAGLGGAAWALLRCDMREQLYRAAPSPANQAEQYLFACGYLWHSPNRGQVWVRVDSTGLPLGVRDGVVAVDRQPGILYLGVLIASSSSVYCWDCAWKFLRPAIYVSTDGGLTWTYTYKFSRGPAGDGGFLGLFGDPVRSNHVWAVIKNGDKITFYASGTQGRNWKSQCVEYYFVGANGCALPKSIQRLFAPLVEPSANGLQ